MDKTTPKTLIILLVVSAWAPYVYCQGSVVDQGREPGTLTASAGARGSESGKAGEKTTGMLRDPFWPVSFSQVSYRDGSQPAISEIAVEDAGGHDELDMSGLAEEEQAIIKSRVRVGGILVQKDECIAIINSQLVKQGDDLSVLTSKRMYQFKIRNLTPDRIVLESVNETAREEGRNP